MIKIIRFVVIRLDIFICSIYGLYAHYKNKNLPQNHIFCFHCVSPKHSGYESISEKKLLKFRDFLMQKGWNELSLERISNLENKSIKENSFNFTFDDGCGGWQLAKRPSFSFCISTDQHTWCCNFNIKAAEFKNIYDHLNNHDPKIYNSSNFLKKYSNGLSDFGEIIVLPFGGANYFLFEEFLSQFRDITLVTTISKSLLSALVFERNLEDLISNNNIQLLHRTSYYRGDNFYSLIGRSYGASNFLQKFMQG